MSNKYIKIISWNINGYRAIFKKGFLKTFYEINADIVALQEIRIQYNQLSKAMKYIDDYESDFEFPRTKKGYSGVAIHSKITPKIITKGIGIERFDVEGRVISMEFDCFVLFCVYFPNGRMNHNRLIYKLDFYEALFDYLDEYRQQGYSLIIVGDFNTAHNNIDLKDPLRNSRNSGFLTIERRWIDKIIKRGYVDTFRFFYPDTIRYSWWSYRNNARKNNAGWRIDYCFVSQDIITKGWLEDAFIYDNILGSDHCPVGVVLKIE